MEFVDDPEFTRLRELIGELELVETWVEEKVFKELPVGKEEAVPPGEGVPPGDSVIVTKELFVIEPRLEEDSELVCIAELLGLCETVEELEGVSITEDDTRGLPVVVGLELLVKDKVDVGV